MKQQYLDMMELALSAYTRERIQDYIREVRQGGARLSTSGGVHRHPHSQRAEG